MITKTKRAIEMIVLGLIIISCFTHSALNSCSASSHETTTTTAKAKKEEIGQLFERACFSENYERAASVAQDISNMAMKDIVSTNGFAVREREREG
jgi:curli biogenesis system outer membrane secretion channel CsgG